MPEPKALSTRQKSNALVRRRHREMAASATLATAFATGAIAAAWYGFDLMSVGVLGALAMLGIFAALERRRKATELRTLGLELRHGQREQLYDVSVRLNPEGSVRVTRLVAVLQCLARVVGEAGAPGEIPGVDDETIFTVTEHLFDGSIRLGHGEKLEKSASLQLPPTLNMPFRKDKEPSVHTTLTLIAEVDGASFLEHEEEVKLDLSQTYPMTLSQT